MSTFADTLRIINVITAICMVPLIYFRIKYMDDKLFTNFKKFVGLLCIGIANGSYYGIGRPFNPGILIITIALIGLIFVTFVDDLKRRWGLADCNGNP